MTRLPHRYEGMVACPACGRPYAAGAFDPARMAYDCEGCGFEFYQHSIPTVTALVPDAAAPSRVLLITRRTAPHVGRLALPGGILSYGEEPAAGAMRETLEETGVAAAVERLLCTTLVDYEYRGRRIAMLELAYVMAPVRADLAARETEEASGLQFVDAATAAAGELAFPEQAAVLARYAAEVPGASVARAGRRRRD